jgi:hypothetical protein
VSLGARSASRESLTQKVGRNRKLRRRSDNNHHIFGWRESRMLDLCIGKQRREDLPKSQSPEMIGGRPLPRLTGGARYITSE